MEDNPEVGGELPDLTKAPKKRGRPKKEDVAVKAELRQPEKPIAEQGDEFKSASKVFPSKYMTHAPTEKDSRLWKEYQRDSKPVKGKFLCHNPKGGSITMSYRKYRWEPIMKYVFRHNETYTIPFGLAMHIQNNCSFAEYAHQTDIYGKKTVGIKGYDSRMDFIPLGFDGEQFELRT